MKFNGYVFMSFDRALHWLIVNKRQGLFFSAASVAGAFSGLLAYAIVKMNGVGGYAGWRWMWALSQFIHEIQ